MDWSSLIGGLAGGLGSGISSAIQFSSSKKAAASPPIKLLQSIKHL